MANPQDTGTFNYWITDRISFNTIPPKSGAVGDFDKWLWDRQFFLDYVGALPAVVVTIPAGVESLVLPISVFEPLVVGSTFISDDLGHKVEGLQVVWAAFGGYWSLRFNLRGNQSIVEDWINGLGRHIELYDGTLRLIWEGFVSQVSATIGSMSLIRGPLLGTVANKVACTFSTVDTSTIPPTVGVRETTDFFEDSDSQDKYGIIERIMSVGGSSRTNAEQIAQTALGELKEPQTDERGSLVSSAEPSVTIDCLGYAHWLKAFTYSSTTTGTQNASTKLQNIITADPNGLLSTDFGDVVANTTQVKAWEQDNRVAWSLVKGIAALGDASFDRYLYGVYKDRKSTYAEMPTDVDYQRRLSDPGQWLENFGSGGHIRPWNALPGRWVFYSDLLTGKTPTAERRLDPRYLFIEQNTYTAPWGLTLEGSKVGKLGQLLASLGLGGTSA